VTTTTTTTTTTTMMMMMAMISWCQCTSNGASAKPLFTWTMERLMSDGQWRPELAICTSSSSSRQLVIPANTLWYMTYRINVTATVSLDGRTTASLDRSAPADTYQRP